MDSLWKRFLNAGKSEKASNFQNVMAADARDNTPSSERGSSVRKGGIYESDGYKQFGENIPAGKYLVTNIDGKNCILEQLEEGKRVKGGKTLELSRMLVEEVLSPMGMAPQSQTPKETRINKDPLVNIPKPLSKERVFDTGSSQYAVESGVSAGNIKPKIETPVSILRHLFSGLVGYKTNLGNVNKDAIANVPNSRGIPPIDKGISGNHPREKTPPLPFEETGNFVPTTSERDDEPSFVGSAVEIEPD